MAEFIDGLAGRLVASGIGTGLYSTSGTSVQVNVRRETGAPTLLLLSQTGGTPHVKGQTEQHGVQVLVDSTTVSGARAKAREVFDHFHGLTAETISGHDVLWVRALALPQAVVVGPGESEQFRFSLNFEALVRQSGDA